jgi:hypothetical protein
MRVRMSCLVILAFTSCGAGADVFTGSCDMRSSLDLCADYQGTSSSDSVKLHGDCDQIGSTWSDTTACTHASAIGGCHAQSTTVSGSLTVWYFPGNGQETVSAVQSTCASSGGTFVTP